MNKTKESWQGHKKKGISEFRASFEHAKSGDEMIKIFKKIESRLEEKQLGLDCWAVALQLHKEGEDHEKTISFGKRALNIFLHDENNQTLGIPRCSLAIGNVLHVLGSACFELKRYDECLSYLNWSDRNLSKLLADNYELDYVYKGLHNTHGVLYKVKKFMGKKDEAIFHARRVLEIDVKMFDDGCIELGNTYMDVSEAYFQVEDFEEALSFCLKALEIYKKHFADDSMEVTIVRIRLGGIYSALKDVGKVYEQNRLSLSGFKRMGNTFRLLMAELEGCQLLVDLGRYAEAIKALRPAISQAEMLVNQQTRAETARNQGVRAIAFMIMAKALCGQKNFAETRKYIKISVRILEKKGLDPKVDAIALMDMSKLYEEMKEYDMAISLMQKALNIPELPQHHRAKCSFRLLSLVSRSGVEENRLSSLVEVLERIKEKYGPGKHNGYACAELGDVYMNFGQPQFAVEFYVRAKDKLRVSLGPHHLDSLRTSQALSVAYAGMESYDLAIENQEEVVKVLEGLGPSEKDKVHDAVEILNTIKGRNVGEISVLMQGLSISWSKDSERHLATTSNGGV